MNRLKRLLWWNKKLDYCVEKDTLEGTTTPVYRVTDPELKQLILEYVCQDVCQIAKSKPHIFPGSMPVPLMQDDIALADIESQGDYLFMEKTDGLRLKFIALTLYSSESFSDEEKQKEADAAKMHQQINPYMPTRPDQLIILGKNTKTYYTKAKKHAEEKRLAAIEHQKNLQRKLMGKTLDDVLVEEEEKKKSVTFVVPSVDSSSGDAPVDEEELEEVEDAEGEGEDEDVGDADISFAVTSLSAPIVGKKTKQIKDFQEITAFITRSKDIYLLTGIGASERFHPMILDCELAVHNPTGLHHLIVWDVDLVNGFSTKGIAPDDRERLYHKMCKMENGLVSFTDAKVAPIFSQFVPKPKFSFALFDQAYARYTSGEYTCDGMLREKRLYRQILWGSNRFVKKMKSAGKNSMDMRPRGIPSNPKYLVLLKLGYVDPSTGHLVVPINPQTNLPVEYIEAKQEWQKTFQYYPFHENPTKSKEEQLVEIDGSIVEFVLIDNYYYAIKFRGNEKDQPNSDKTIQDTKRNIKEGLTPEKFYQDVFLKWKNRAIESSTTSSDIRYGTALPTNFINTMMHYSNWHPQIIPTSQLRQEITTSDLSWSRNDKSLIHSFQEEETKSLFNAVQLLEEKHFHSGGACDLLNLEEIQKILDVEGLKPIVKKKSTRRKPGAAAKAPPSKKKKSKKKKKKEDEDERVDDVEDEDEIEDEEEDEEDIEEEDDPIVIVDESD